MGLEYVRALPCIDYAVVGEGDTGLPELLRRARPRGATRRTCPASPRRAGRHGSVDTARRADRATTWTSCPTPDYDEYFAAPSASGCDRRRRSRTARILFESARGLLVGREAPLHVLRAQRLEHALPLQVAGAGARRAPPPVRAVPQIPTSRPSTTSWTCATSKALFPAGRGRAATTTTLLRGQGEPDAGAAAHCSRRAGVDALQPGIECLEHPRARAHAQGDDRCRTSTCCKWAHYYGIKVAWNMLWGFPGETAEDYARQAQLMPAARPPAAARRRRPDLAGALQPVLHRGLVPGHRRRALGGYSYVYPPELDVRKIAYFFAYEMGDVVPEKPLTDVHAGSSRGKALATSPKRPVLVYQRAPDWIQIVDQRDAEETEAHSFQGTGGAAYELCGDIENAGAGSAELDASGRDVESALRDVLRPGPDDRGGRQVPQPRPAGERELVSRIGERLDEFAATLPPGEQAALRSLLRRAAPRPAQEILAPDEVEVYERLRTEPDPDAGGQAVLTVIMKATRLATPLHLLPQLAQRAEPEDDVRVLAHSIHGALRDPSVGYVDFVWHGGEVTVLPVEFYRKALWLQERFRRPGQTVLNTVQTNATRLSDEWLAFLHDHDIGVGVSLDGPPEIHDARRVDAAGRPTLGTRARGNRARSERPGITRWGVLMVVDGDVCALGPRRLLEYLTEIGVKRVPCSTSSPRTRPTGTPLQGRLPVLPPLRATSCAGCSSLVERIRDRIVVSDLADLSRPGRRAPRRSSASSPAVVSASTSTIEPTGRCRPATSTSTTTSIASGTFSSPASPGVQSAERLAAVRRENAARRRADARLPLVRRLPWRLPARPLHE